MEGEGNKSVGVRKYNRFYVFANLHKQVSPMCLAAKLHAEREMQCVLSRQHQENSKRKWTLFALRLDLRWFNAVVEQLGGNWYPVRRTKKCSRFVKLEKI